MLLLAFFLNGCATTSKSTKESATSSTNAATQATDAANATPTDAVNPGASSDTNTPANVGAAANADAPAKSAANEQKNPQESFDGPVFKNAAPVAYPITYTKRDPWEPMNRAVFKFNESVDDYVFRPVAVGYKTVMPVPIQMMIGNVYSNVNDIPVTLNNLLQFKFHDALRSSMRVVVNTTFGLGGIVDLASDIGLEKHDEDFGQTLGYHGVASGPYVVLPFLGPSSTRDAGGRVLDIAADPVFVGSFFVAPFIGPIVGATRAADTRAGLLKSEKTLDEAALDKYEFIRDAYLQRRRSLVHDGNPPKSKDDEDD